MYGGLKPGFWNDGAHGVTTVSKTSPDLHYVHVMTKPATADHVTLGDNGYRIARVTNLRTGAAMAFTQAGGALTIQGITGWDTYDTVFKVETAGRVGVYPTGVARATASASSSGFPARHLTDGDYLTYWDSNTTLPVSITLDLGAPRAVSYLAVNQREWSPTYNRSSFGRPEDSARIKDYRVYASNDGITWGEPVVTAVMPSARAVQYVNLDALQAAYRYVKLEVLSTWAAANAPNYYRKLRIDELWVGSGHPSPAVPDSTTTYEAEGGIVRGFARVVTCQPCSGGAKVTTIGNDVGNDVTLVVDVPRRGDYLVTVVGSVAGTRSVTVAVNNRRPVVVPITGSSELSPLLGRSVQTQLRPGPNVIRLSNDTAYAPDIDRIIVSRL
jgi:hypothetical protein